MAKATVLKCDTCGEWDSAENPVKSIVVAGPKFELCATDRIKVIMAMGVTEEKARAFVRTYDAKESTRGAQLSLNGRTVREAVRADQAATRDESAAESEPVQRFRGPFGPCANPWHGTSPGRAQEACPECPEGQAEGDQTVADVAAPEGPARPDTGEQEVVAQSVTPIKSGRRKS